MGRESSWDVYHVNEAVWFTQDNPLAPELPFKF